MISKSRHFSPGSLSSFLLNLCLTAHHLCRALETVVGVTEPDTKKSIQFCVKFAEVLDSRGSPWYIMVPWLLYRKFMSQELWAPRQPEVFKKYPSGTVLGFGPHTVNLALNTSHWHNKNNKHNVFQHAEFWDPLQTHWAGVHSKASIDSLTPV